MTVEDADKLHDQIKKMNFNQLRLMWRWVTMEMGGRIETGRHVV